MIRIDSIDRCSATRVRVIFSLSPVNSTHPVWCSTEVSDTTGPLELDWLLRNHWAREESARASTETDTSSLCILGAPALGSPASLPLLGMEIPCNIPPERKS